MPLKKIGRAIKKTVRKVVPKEVAGIMTAAAPFVAPYSLPAAAALSIGGQLRTGQGRINPILTGMSLLPGVRFQGGAGPGAFMPSGFTRFGPQDFGSGITARQLLFGGPNATGKLGAFGDKAESFLFGSPAQAATSELDEFASVKAKQGLLGFGGTYGTGGSLISNIGEGGAPVLSKTKIGAAAAAGLSLTQTQAQIEQEGLDDGLTNDEIARLQQEAAEMWEDFDTTAFKPNVKDGGLMRTKFAMGSKGEGDELPPDPTTPVNPFKPKPIGPVLPNKAEITANSMAIDIFGMPFNDLPEAQQNAILDLMGMGKPQAKQGGLMRSNFALGTEPTKEESGLGGLPIEADMRYSGGFMPYGAKEKADDVPARLSKNEFVFTADAVRAAGGGSVQKGAQKMYNTMKQLESMGAMA